MIAALAGFIITLYGKARFNAGILQERVAWTEIVAKAERKVADQRVATERRVVDAVERYAERVSSAEPLVVHSKETVTRYAQTPAGAVVCLAADRLLGIEADRAALFAGYPPAPVSVIDPLPAVSPAHR